MLWGLAAPPESLRGGGCTDRLTAFGNGYDSGGHQVVDSFATCLLPFASFFLIILRGECCAQIGTVIRAAHAARSGHRTACWPRDRVEVDGMLLPSMQLPWAVARPPLSPLPSCSHSATSWGKRL